MGTAPATALRIRSAALTARAATLDREARTVSATLSTEEPVLVGGVREALLASGLRIVPASVPFLDAHDRSTVADILGSVRAIKRGARDVSGQIVFAETSEAERAMDLVAQGHLTAVSVGYSVEEETFVPAGKRQTVAGREYVGPVAVVTAWTLREVSAVPVGADPNAQFRADGAPKGKTTMETTTTPEAPASGARVLTMEEAREFDNLRREREVRELCRLAGYGVDRTEGHVRSGKTADEVRAAILAEREAANPPLRRSVADSREPSIAGRHIEFTRSGDDDWREGTIDALLIRAGVRIDDKARAERAHEFRSTTIAGLAAGCLEARGERVSRNLSNDQVIERALQLRTGPRFTSTDRLRSMTTSDLPSLLANIATKAVMTGFAQVPTTFQRWTRKESLPDFKDAKLVALSEFPDPSEISEAGEIPFAAVSDAGETWNLVTYGRRFRITRKAMVNDDLSQIVLVPLRMAAAFRRKQQKIVSDILNNGTAATYNMRDGNPLFDATNHANYATTGTALAIGSLDAAVAAFAKQTGFNSTDDADELIGVEPRFLVVPPALSFTAAQLVNSSSIIVANGNSAIVNPLSGRFEVVVDPFLSSVNGGGSDTAWYLAADPMLHDAIAVGYLGGNEEPTVQEKEDWDFLAMEFRIFGDFGAKAADWRGIRKSSGAGG